MPKRYHLNRPDLAERVAVELQGQRASALRFGDARVQALLATIVLFCLQPQGFTHKQLRPLLAQYLGVRETDISRGRISYDLRRLRLHGLIQRKEKSHRYQLSSIGLKAALFYSRTYNRVIRPGLSLLQSPLTNQNTDHIFPRVELQIVRHSKQSRARAIGINDSHHQGCAEFVRIEVVPEHRLDFGVSERASDNRRVSGECNRYRVQVEKESEDEPESVNFS